MRAKFHAQPPRPRARAPAPGVVRRGVRPLQTGPTCLLGNKTASLTARRAGFAAARSPAREPGRFPRQPACRFMTRARTFLRSRLGHTHSATEYDRVRVRCRCDVIHCAPGQHRHGAGRCRCASKFDFFGFSPFMDNPAFRPDSEGWKLRDNERIRGTPPRVRSRSGLPDSGRWKPGLSPFRSRLSDLRTFPQ